MIRIPPYTRELDYELELGAVLCKPLKNASPEEAADAIGGFVVFNDFSARDVQLDEMTSGFGPMKSKNFADSISNVVVSANEVLPVIDRLRASVWINGEKIAENDMAGMHYSLPEAIAYASWKEELHPGEFFGSGTIAGCTGIENGRFLSSGDSIRLEIMGVVCWEIKQHKNSESRILCESACKMTHLSSKFGIDIMTSTKTNRLIYRHKF